MIQNTVGQLGNRHRSFLGSFNVGMGLAGAGRACGQGQHGPDDEPFDIGAEQRRGYGMDCFGNLVDAANADTPPMPRMRRRPGKTKSNRKKRRVSDEQLKAVDKNGNPAVSCAIVACGEEDGILRS